MKKLNIKTAFKDWFPRMCEYGFDEGKDFCSKMSETSSKGGRPSIYACEKNNIPSLVFYYIAEQDAIVLNEAHKSFKHFRELLISYLEFDDLQKKEFLVMPRKKGITFFRFS